MSPSPAPGVLDEIMTDPELCARLRIDRQSSLNWRKKGDLPYFRIGTGRGTIRYRRSEVEAWLLARRQGK